MEEAESVCPAVHLLIEPPQPPTHQPAVYQLRLPRETASYSVLPFVLPCSADQIDRRFSKSQDERLACWCVYGILQATVNQNGEKG